MAKMAHGYPRESSRTAQPKSEEQMRNLVPANHLNESPIDAVAIGLILCCLCLLFYAAVFCCLLGGWGVELGWWLDVGLGSLFGG